MSALLQITDVLIEAQLRESPIRGVEQMKIHPQTTRETTETTEIAATALVVALEDKILISFDAQKTLRGVFCTPKEDQIFNKDHPTKCSFVGFYGRRFSV